MSYFGSYFGYQALGCGHDCGCPACRVASPMLGCRCHTSLPGLGERYIEDDDDDDDRPPRPPPGPGRMRTGVAGFGYFSGLALQPTTPFGQAPPIVPAVPLRRPPGGGFVFPPTARGGGGLGWGFGECVPAVGLLSAAQVTTAVANNPRFASLVGWRPLRDMIEVNILSCARAAARLSDADFAQAVAGFQNTQGLPVDGMLGPTTWTRMKALRVEREPFPRNGLTQDFDDTPSAFACEGHVHPAIDVDVAAATPIPAVADGVVRYAGDVGRIVNCANATACQNGTGPAATCNFVSYGRAVIIEHSDRGPGMQPGGDSVFTIHAHVQFTPAHRVGSGEPVRAGRLIAEVGAGCVGFSTGPHLHYAVVTGPRARRFTAGGPARCEVCSNTFCLAATCPRCNFPHFWDQVTPQRPRTTGGGAGFQW